MPKRRRSFSRRRRSFRRRPSRRSSFRRRGRSGRRWANRVWKAVIRKAETKWIENYGSGALTNYVAPGPVNTPTGYVNFNYPIEPTLITTGTAAQGRIGNRIQITACEWKIRFLFNQPMVMNATTTHPPPGPPVGQGLDALLPTRLRKMLVVPRDGTVTTAEMFPPSASTNDIQPWNQPLQQDFMKLFKDRTYTMSPARYITNDANPPDTGGNFQVMGGKTDIMLRIRKRFRKGLIFEYTPGGTTLVKPPMSMWFFQDLTPTIDAFNASGQYLQYQLYQRCWFKDV